MVLVVGIEGRGGEVEVARLVSTGAGMEGKMREGVAMVVGEDEDANSGGVVARVGSGRAAMRVGGEDAGVGSEAAAAISGSPSAKASSATSSRTPFKDSASSSSPSTPALFVLLLSFKLANRSPSVARLGRPLFVRWTSRGKGVVGSATEARRPRFGRVVAIWERERVALEMEVERRWRAGMDESVCWSLRRGVSCVPPTE